MDLGEGTGLGERIDPLYVAPTRPYRSLVRLSNVVIALLTVHIVFDLAAVVVDVQMLGLLGRIQEGDLFTVEEVLAHDERVFRVGALQAIAELVVGVAFIAWLRRAYGNLGSLGIARLRFKLWWTIAGWFVPFMSLARPKSIVNDVWRASGPEVPRYSHRPPEGAPVAGVVNWWWGFFVVGSCLYPIDLGSGSLPATVGGTIFLMRRIALSDAAIVVAGVLAIVVVRRPRCARSRGMRRLPPWPPSRPADSQGRGPRWCTTRPGGCSSPTRWRTWRRSATTGGRT